MLGQPITMLLPEVIGVSVKGALKEGVTATDLVPANGNTQKLWSCWKVCGIFWRRLDIFPVSDRATLSNMAPEFGSTCAIFPIDEATIRYLNSQGEANTRSIGGNILKIQGLWRETDSNINYTDVIVRSFKS